MKILDGHSILECFPDFYKNKGLSDYWYGATDEIKFDNHELVQKFIADVYTVDITILKEMGINVIDESNFIEDLRSGGAAPQLFQREPWETDEEYDERFLEETIGAN